MRRPYRLAFCAAVAAFAVDQLCKFIVTYPLDLPRRGTIDFVSFFGFRWKENKGVSMSYLTAGDELGRWLLVAFTSLICAGIAVWLMRERRRDNALALALILGGACGNILDRIRYGYVVDFADLHFGGWRPFQIFNGADAAISIGVVLLLGVALLARKQKPD
jgi:signal peptidase II